MNLIEAFKNLDIRTGTIIRAEVFKEVKKPAYKLWIDFGELGIKKTSAQLTVMYAIEDLVNKQVVAIVNFEPKQIANFMSECLILGALEADGAVNLLTTDKPGVNGSRIA